jgi:hypothetical protein
MLLASVSALALASMSRVNRAKVAIYNKFGFVPEGAARYRTLCPKGAGHGPARHQITEQKTVGARKFFRRQARLAKRLGFDVDEVAGRARMEEQGRAFSGCFINPGERRRHALMEMVALAKR